jgi:hypothetical protein
LLEATKGEPLEVIETVALTLARKHCHPRKYGSSVYVYLSVGDPDGEHVQLTAAARKTTKEEGDG